MSGKSQFCLKSAAGLALLIFVASCSSINMPTGKQKKSDSTVRFMRLTPDADSSIADRSDVVNARLQSAVLSECKAHGLVQDVETADLIIGYMLIKQDGVTTTMIDEYFGYNRDQKKISEKIHKKHVIKRADSGDHPEALARGAVVVDVLRGADNKLVYRGYAIRNLSGDKLTESQFGALVDDCVKEALQGFFK